MVTFAGNPVLSAPNGRRLAAALGRLEFMVSIDIYVNETTRHADVILPPCWNLAEDHIDLLFSADRRAQHRALVAAGGRTRRGRARRLGDPARP